MTVRGILFSQMDEPPGQEAEFHDWYDTEHIPDRLVIPGFAAASRYEVVDGEPRWMVIYELDDLAAFERPEYVKLKTEPSERTRLMLATVNGFTRYTCDLRAESGEAGDHERVGVEAFTVPAGGVAEFETWDDDRRVASVEKAGRRRVRRYRVLEGAGGPWTHLVVHELMADAEWDPQRADGSWHYLRRSRQEAGAG